jgi:hypothetical protein
MKMPKVLFSFFVLAMFALTGCPELGQIGGSGDYGSMGGDLVGEVRYVDSRDRQIELRTDQGRNWVVRYDNNTRVVYRQRNYAVYNLEPGDYVSLRPQQDRDGRYYTDLITVRQSAQDRGYTRGGPRLDRFEGRVEYIDSRRGQFEIRDRGNRLVVVALQYNPPRSISDRFNRLRAGDYIRIEGRFINQDRFELENFL